MRSVSPRVVVMPAIALAVAAAIWFFNRDGRRPAPPKSGDSALALRKLAEGKEKLARALDPAAPDWARQAAEASRLFQHAIAADGDLLEAREGAARAQALSGHFMSAQDHLNYVLKRDPDRPELRELRGQLAWRMAFENDAHVPPRPPPLFTLTRAPRISPAKEDFRQRSLADIPAGAGRFPLREAEDLFRAGRLDEAAAKAREADPRWLERTMLLAMIALEKGEDPFAALEYAASCGYGPALMLRARIALERGDWEQARQNSRRIADRQVRWPDALLYLGIAKLRLGDPIGALDALKKAESIDPSIDKRWREEAEAAVEEMRKRLAPPK